MNRRHWISNIILWLAALVMALISWQLTQSDPRLLVVFPLGILALHFVAISVLGGIHQAAVHEARYLDIWRQAEDGPVPEEIPSSSLTGSYARLCERYRKEKFTHPSLRNHLLAKGERNAVELASLFAWGALGLGIVGALAGLFLAADFFKDAGPIADGVRIRFLHQLFIVGKAPLGVALAGTVGFVAVTLSRRLLIVSSENLRDELEETFWRRISHQDDSDQEGPLAQLTRAVADLPAQIRQVEDRWASAATEFDRRAEAGAKALREGADQVAARAAEATSAAAAQVASALPAAMEAWSREFRTQTEAMSSAWAEQIRALSERLDASSAGLSGGVAQASQALAERLAAASSAIAERTETASVELAERLAAASAAIIQRTETVSAELAERVGAVSTELVGTAQAIGSLSGAFRDEVGRASQAIAALPADIGRSIEASAVPAFQGLAERLAPSLETGLVQSAERVEALQREALSTWDRNAQAQSQSLDRAAQEILTALQLSTEELSQRFSERLQAAFAPLGDLLEAHRQGLAPLGESLSTTAGSLERLAPSLEKTGTVLDDLLEGVRSNQVEFAAGVATFTQAAETLALSAPGDASSGQAAQAEIDHKALLEGLSRILAGFSETLQQTLADTSMRTQEVLVELCERLESTPSGNGAA